MHITALPLPLSCTVNTASAPIMENGESVFDKNNRLRAKIGLPPLPQPGTVVQLDSNLIVNASTAIVSTTEKEDVDDNETTICTKNDKGRSLRKLKRKKIVKKKSKTKFAGLAVEGVPTLWLELEIDVVSIVEDMKQSSLYVNCLSKNNRFVVDCHLELLFTNHLWIQFKHKCDSSLSDCMVRKEMEIGARSTKYFRQCTENQQWLQIESFNILAPVMSIVFHDEWRTSILLLSHEFLRLYHKYHIYSTDAGELGKKLIHSSMNRLQVRLVMFYNI